MNKAFKIFTTLTFIFCIFIALWSWIEKKRINLEERTLQNIEEYINKKEPVPTNERDLAQRIEKTDLQVIELKTKFDTTNSMLNSIFVFVTLLFALVAVPSLYGWYKSEKRATEAHSYALTSAKVTEERATQAFSLAIAGESAAQNRATEAHSYALSSAKVIEERATQAFSLAITGETAAQKRASEVHEQFLSASKETLDLVNATLTLAKEASERAAKIIERKALATVEKLDKDSQFLLASVPTKDDRALIATPAKRSDLRSIAHNIIGFEINRFVLPEDIKLTPPCLFIKGMDFHLSQQFNDAIESWREVALSNDADNNLKSLAWYWIGYEQNNLNRFDEAELSFNRALEYATGIRKYELQRIQLETRFFNQSKNSARNLVKPFENLLSSIESENPDEERDARKTRIVVTLANVVNQAGRELIKAGKKKESKQLFAKAKDYYQSVSYDKWAAVGLAEMLFELGETEQAINLFKEKIRNEATEEYVRREEPRTKVLARTTELICCVRVPDWQDEAPTIRGLVIQELGRVDERLTVYSQIQKRNVTKTVFQDDLDEIMSQLPEQKGQKS